MVRKEGHAWLLLDRHHQLLDSSEGAINACHLTEGEIKRLHRRFGHPSVKRLQHLLDQAGHVPDSEIMLRVKEMCEHCQKHSDAPHRFRFKLQDDIDFNHTVYVDIAMFGKDYALHMVDEATGFGAAKLLRKAPGSHTAKQVVNAFKSAWIDTYIGPPDFVVYDYGTNFNSENFRSSLRAMSLWKHTIRLVRWKDIIVRSDVPTKSTANGRQSCQRYSRPQWINPYTSCIWSLPQNDRNGSAKSISSRARSNHQESDEGGTQTARKPHGPGRSTDQKRPRDHAHSRFEDQGSSACVEGEQRVAGTLRISGDGRRNLQNQHGQW